MTTQYGAPLTGAQMKLLRAAGLAGRYKAVTCTSAIMGPVSAADFSIRAEFYLPADHAAYTLLEAGWLDGRNVALWFGGEKAPDDWDGEKALLQNGTFADPYFVKGVWWPEVIAYTRKADDIVQPSTFDEIDTQPETVTIAKMTEAEAAEWLRENGWFGGGRNLNLLKMLGLIKPEPTREDRFWASQPNGGAHVADDIKVWVREALNFERRD